MKIHEALPSIFEGKIIYRVKKDNYEKNEYYKLVKCVDFKTILRRYGDDAKWEVSFIHIDHDQIDDEFKILEEIKGEK